MAVTAAQVKELRERTNAGMMDCKRALDEFDGDLEKAVDSLKKKGIIKAAKKEGRITAEGLVAIEVAHDAKSGVLVEVNCETDFLKSNDYFKAFVEHFAKRVLELGLSDLADVMSSPYTAGTEETIEQARQALVAKIGENITVRRFHYLVAEGTVVAYIHGERIAVLVDAESSDKNLPKDLAMHIAANTPLVVMPEEVSQDLIAKEREVYSAQAAESGKPADIVEKMVEGRITKYLKEVSLMGQPFVKDPSSDVAAVLKANNAKVHSFVRYEVGEGIKKKEDNFVQDVMEQIQGSN